jgi:hypothetical protein
MKPLTVQDVLPPDAYEASRQEFRQRIIELKADRRISVGDLITLVFENRRTLLFQIQEMIRAERIQAADRIEEEVATYNEQLPGPGELSATLLIEVVDADNVKSVMDRFQGIDRGKSVWLEVGRHRVAGTFEQGRSKEDKISAVHYVRFQIPDVVKADLANLQIPMEVVIHHSSYQAKAQVPAKMRQSLLDDLNSD